VTLLQKSNRMTIQTGQARASLFLPYGQSKPEKISLKGKTFLPPRTSL